MLLQAYIDREHRDHNQHDRGGHQAVVYAGLRADLIEQARDGALLRITQEEGLGKEIVVAPEESKDRDRGKGGLCRRNDDVEIDLKDAAAVQIGALLQLDRH